jgi:hypothetical protein
MNNEVGNDGGSTEIPRNVKVKKGWKKVLLEKVWSWLTHKDKDKWLKDMRGNLSLVATVIATITFQMALNPSPDPLHFGRKWQSQVPFIKTRHVAN